MKILRGFIKTIFYLLLVFLILECTSCSSDVEEFSKNNNYTVHYKVTGDKEEFHTSIEFSSDNGWRNIPNSEELPPVFGMENPDSVSVETLDLSRKIRVSYFITPYDIEKESKVTLNFTTYKNGTMVETVNYHFTNSAFDNLNDSIFKSFSYPQEE